MGGGGGVGIQGALEFEVPCFLGLAECMHFLSRGSGVGNVNHSFQASIQASSQICRDQRTTKTRIGALKWGVVLRTLFRGGFWRFLEGRSL